MLIPGVRHGFIGATEAATKDALRRALTATFDFFDRVLHEPPAATPDGDTLQVQRGPYIEGDECRGPWKRPVFR